MSATKEAFIRMREEEAQDTHLDDEYRYNEWMARLDQKKNHTSNSAIEVLDDLFVTFGKIYCPHIKENKE